jgi:hypothetical protein
MADTDFDRGPSRAGFALMFLALAPALTPYQGRWQEIGKTSTGNPVYVDPKSVKKDAGIVTATVRVTFVDPVKVPQGKVTASRAVAKFDCAKKMVAVLENTMYTDEKSGAIYQKSVPKVPGFGPTFTSNFSGVALAYLCK